MDINKGKEKMVMEREVIIIESNTSCDHKPFQVTYGESCDHNPFQVTSDKGSDYNPFQATFDEISDYNPFQATSDESSDNNPFQVSSDDTLKSSFEDTHSSDSTWEQKKLLDVNQDEQWTVYKGRPGSSSRNAAITKPEKPKSRSKHLAPTTPRTGSTCITLVVSIKRPPLVTNCVLGLAVVTN
ncbi:hypothetical protein Tco_0683612 [Tanacetum coccineum]